MLYSSIEELLRLQRLFKEVRFVILLEFYNASIIRVSHMRLRKMKRLQAASRRHDSKVQAGNARGKVQLLYRKERI
jgi:hypothetical protein